MYQEPGRSDLSLANDRSPGLVGGSGFAARQRSGQQALLVL